MERMVDGARRYPRRARSGWAVLVAALLTLSSGLDATARNRGADGKFEKRVSSHFALYQDVAIDRTSGLRGSRHFENQVLATLESAYRDLDELLSLRPRRRIDVVVYDPQIFDDQYGGLFRFSAAGFYSGRIHIRGDTQVRAPLVRTLHHELVHAAFAAAAPSLELPGWLNEGLAEWFEARSLGKRRLSPGEARYLEHVAAGGQLFALWQLSGRSFGHLRPQSAQLAYLQSYAFIEYLTRRHGDRSVRELCDTLLRMRNLARAFALTYRADLETLEGRFVSDYGGSSGG